MDPSFLPAAKLAQMTRGREIGCLELLDHYISRIGRLDGPINAVVVKDFDRARERARALDQATDRSAPLFGVPTSRACRRPAAIWRPGIIARRRPPSPRGGWRRRVW